MNPKKKQSWREEDLVKIAPSAILFDFDKEKIGEIKERLKLFENNLDFWKHRKRNKKTYE